MFIQNLIEVNVAGTGLIERAVKLASGQAIRPAFLVLRQGPFDHRGDGAPLAPGQPMGQFTRLGTSDRKLWFAHRHSTPTLPRRTIFCHFSHLDGNSHPAIFNSQQIRIKGDFITANCPMVPGLLAADVYPADVSFPPGKPVQFHGLTRQPGPGLRLMSVLNLLMAVLCMAH